MTLFVTILHFSLCVILVAIVLVQHGKGADMGVALGGGGSQTVFGARGAGNFLTKLTAGAAALFMMTSLFLSYFAGPEQPTDLLLGDIVPAEAPVAPALGDVPQGAEAETAPTATPGAEGEGEVPTGFEEIPAPEAQPGENPS